MYTRIVFQHVAAPRRRGIRHPHDDVTRRLQPPVCASGHRSTRAGRVPHETHLQVRTPSRRWPPCPTVQRPSTLLRLAGHLHCLYPQPTCIDSHVFTSSIHFQYSLPSIHFQYSLPVFTSSIHFQYSIPVFTSSIHFQYSLPVFTSSIHFRYSLPVFTSGIHFRYPQPVS